MSEHTGVLNGKLRPCPSSPNCVCSHAQNSTHAIDPLPLKRNDAKASLAKITEILRQESRTKLVEERSGYLRFEFTSLIFRFVDDVEFLVSESEKVVHVRSASRVGYSDLGVNRSRIEALRAKYLA